MVTVEFNKKYVNPFYGLRNCLNLYQNNANVTEFMLDKAWEEVKDNEEKVKLFYSICFCIGDVTNRQHNIFKNKKVDSGGMSCRESFYTFTNWLIHKNLDQFKKFLFAGLFNEYNCFDTLLRNRVQSTRTGVVTNTYTMLTNSEYRTILAEYFYKVLNSHNPFNKHLIAKFLTPPRLGKRSKHTKMLSETHTLMKAKADFLKELSDLMGWCYTYVGNFANFKGFRRWRQDYNGENESVLFSTGKIKEFSKDEFISWIDKQPALARDRVLSRITESDKWPNLYEWFEEWQDRKLKAQAEQRILEEKVRQGQASEEDVKRLSEVKQEAKVTTGATTFLSLFRDIRLGNIDQLKLETFVQKVNLPYNNLVLVDASGSMSGGPYNFAKFLAAVCLVKNPDDTGRNLFGLFSNEAKLYHCIDAKTDGERPNSFWARQKGVAITPEPLVDPTKSFYDNYLRINDYMDCRFVGGGTNISSIPECLNKICKQDPETLDVLKNYPIWTLISDNEFNNMWSPESSMNDFMRKCEDYFGYRPFIIAIDVNVYPSHVLADRFSGVDNFMYIPAAPEIIEQVLINFKDMDRFDVYTPLQSIYRSNRYELVKNNIL